jgi:hypothetical protein
MSPNDPGAPSKKSNLVWWILGGCLGLVLLGALATGVGGFLLFQRVKNAGIDAELFKTNPALAAAKLATAVNPDVEIVSTDDRTGEIIIRDRKTGKETTMRFDPDKKELVVVDEEGKKASIRVREKEGGGVEAEAGGDRVRIGTSAQIPAWIPAYPGAAVQGVAATERAGETQYVFSVGTSDSLDEVSAYYRNQLRRAGFDVDSTAATPGAEILQAKTAGRTVQIVLSKSDGATLAAITAAEKK